MKHKWVLKQTSQMLVDIERHRGSKTESYFAAESVLVCVGPTFDTTLISNRKPLGV